MRGAPHLVSVIGEVDLVENLGRLVLDGLHLHQMRRVLPRPIPEPQREGKHEPLGSRGNKRLAPA